MKNREFKKGMALIAAIIVMMLIAVLGGLMMSLSTQSVKHTEANYLNEQGRLLAKSATEYALLAISAHDVVGSDSCINSINAFYPSAASPMFDINTTIRYIGYGSITNCNDYIESISTSESNGTVLIDVYVSTNASLGLAEPLRYHKRTIQKP